MAMVQYDLWNNCSNSCDFCLIYRKRILDKAGMIERIDQIIDNINYVGDRWTTQFSDGISLLGGEVYFITDPDVQEKLMELIDHIIDKILLPNKALGHTCKYSTVTNGIYQPDLLFRMVDRVVERAGIEFVDVNFSYDLKYRFHTEEARLLCLENMRKFSERYNYRIGAQMVVTEYLIDMINNKEFDIGEFQDKIVPNSIVEFLYPHEVHTGKVLDDFQFPRNKFLKLEFVSCTKHIDLETDAISMAQYDDQSKDKRADVGYCLGLQVPNGIEFLSWEPAAPKHKAHDDNGQHTIEDREDAVLFEQ